MYFGDRWKKNRERNDQSSWQVKVEIERLDRLRLPRMSILPVGMLLVVASL